jgi:hypothetical protein
MVNTIPLSAEKFDVAFGHGPEALEDLASVLTEVLIHHV